TNDNAEYGIFPSLCGAGRVTMSVATGANDTGIYIGQSHDVRIDHNVATDNVSGFEIENSSAVRCDHNRAFGNTGGILSFALPGLDVTQNADNRIDHNASTDKGDSLLRRLPPAEGSRPAFSAVCHETRAVRSGLRGGGREGHHEAHALETAGQAARRALRVERVEVVGTELTVGRGTAE